MLVYFDHQYSMFVLNIIKMINNVSAKKACIYTRPLFINVYIEKRKTITSTNAILKIVFLEELCFHSDSNHRIYDNWRKARS